MKREIISVVLIVLLAGLVLLGCASTAQVDELEAQVTQLETQLAELRSELNMKDTRISELESQVTQVTELQDELDTKDTRITQLQAQSTELRGELNVKDTRIAELQAELAEFPKDPSYDELMEFLAEDETEKLWPPATGGHLAMAHEFLGNASEAGIRGFLVYIYIKANQCWYFAGFNTIDQGRVYILTPMDQEIKLEVGKKYHELNNFDSFGFDDTIEEITAFSFN